MSKMVQDLAADALEQVETHISWVFLTRDRVYKVKKPVDFGFLDFSTAAKRKEACDAEVRLNRRLAPDVYESVLPVTRDSQGRHRVGGDGETVDWAVCMRRLDDSTRADDRLQAGTLTEADVTRIAARLAAFHRNMPTNEEIARFGEADAVLGNVRENFDQTRQSIERYVSPAEAEEIQQRQIGFIEKSRALFDERVRQGRVRDGHGDLRLEHIYLEGDEKVTVIDCIEFNDRFRYADVCADIAFLSMDLVKFGRVDLAEWLLAIYARESSDYDLYALIDFYEGYRAYVRGKVATLLAADADAGHEVRARAAERARRDFLLALAAQRRSMMSPVLVAVGGVIASGKSTVAERLGSRMSAPVVDSDRTRKSLAGVEFTQKLEGGAWSGAYAPEQTDKVYAEVLRRADRVLASGRPVVIDASFRTKRWRSQARELARRHGVAFFFVECRADRESIRRRLVDRERGRTVSDGRVHLLDDFIARWEPADELGATERIVIDTARPLAENEERLTDRLPVWPPGLTA